ncbi:LEA type 2 family protein [uncultured Methylophaga sp.]|uniref:LEA type 2 family protein n=1 Tax=uncultured Methylophaga sp. TaxID=285271 RepID=UPI002624AF13|nr:LEA type 2 family protein [uncultured Methylophaga sp.]
MPYFKRLLLVLMLMALSACASLWSSYEKPQVSITSFSVAPGTTGATPTFLIGLRVVNPNRKALPLQGMSYSLEVEDQRVLSGAEPNLPELPGYGTAEFTINAVPDLLGSARLLNQLLSRRQENLGYRFKAKFDVGGLLPYLTLEERGEFGLSNSDRNSAY